MPLSRHMGKPCGACIPWDAAQQWKKKEPLMQEPSWPTTVTSGAWEKPDSEECDSTIPFRFPFSSFFFFFFFPTASGTSQARGWIGATATGLHHSHSNAGSKLCLQPTPQLMAMPDPGPTKRGQGSKLHPHRYSFPLSHNGNSIVFHFPCGKRLKLRDKNSSKVSRLEWRQHCLPRGERGDVRERFRSSRRGAVVNKSN